MINPLFTVRSVVRTVATTVVCLLLVGCVSKKPIPYAFSPAKTAGVGAPTLRVANLQDVRAKKDDMDKLMALPDAVTVVLAKELENSGLFKKVETKGKAGGSADFVLSGDLFRFAWEVPNHGAMVGKAFAISLATGGIGGLAYGSTSTDVLGHVKVRFVLTGKEGASVLDKEYTAEVKEKRAKLNSDLPKTRREMVAKALKQVVDEFKGDLEKAVAAQAAVVAR